MMSYPNMRLMSFDFVAHAIIMSLSILSLQCGYYIHVNSWGGKYPTDREDMLDTVIARY